MGHQTHHPLSSLVAMSCPAVPWPACWATILPADGAPISCAPQPRKWSAHINLHGFLHPGLHLLLQALPKIRVHFVLKHEGNYERLHGNGSAPSPSASFYSIPEGPAQTICL